MSLLKPPLSRGSLRVQLVRPYLKRFIKWQTFTIRAKTKHPQIVESPHLQQYCELQLFRPSHLLSYRQSITVKRVPSHQALIAGGLNDFPHRRLEEWNLLYRHQTDFCFLPETKTSPSEKLLLQRLPEHAVSVSLFTSARDMVLVNITQAAWLVLNARNNGTGITVSISRIQTSNLSSQFTHWLRWLSGGYNSLRYSLKGL